MRKFKIGDLIENIDTGNKGLVTFVDPYGGVINETEENEEWFFFNEDDWDFAENQRQLDPYTESTPPEAPEYVYKGVKTHNLILTIPEGTKRLEGEFEGYKVILEKL